MKIYEENSGYVVHEVIPHNAMHIVYLKSNDGEVLDRVHCDTLSAARAYIRSFRKIAKNRGQK